VSSLLGAAKGSRALLRAPRAFNDAVLALTRATDPRALDEMGEQSTSSNLVRVDRSQDPSERPTVMSWANHFERVSGISGGAAMLLAACEYMVTIPRTRGERVSRARLLGDVTTTYTEYRTGDLSLFYVGYGTLRIYYSCVHTWYIHV
jgi:hypothetical protein